MIAGALVNQKDIDQSIYTPDVDFPRGDPAPDEWVFFSKLPQALSTRAEMMTRYDGDGPDGRNEVIQRFHVTGGTCGIFVETLRAYRPFTPGFIGRAEDQAYLMSILLEKSEGNLRYVHKPGLIMRHDTKEIAGDAERSASVGKLIGDYVRLLLFSHWASELPWGMEATKHLIDPFTGCFVSHIPLTVVHLRLSLKAATLIADGKGREALDLLESGSSRLKNVIDSWINPKQALTSKFQEEKVSWNHFYDLLDGLEEGLKRKEPKAENLRILAKDIIMKCKIVG
jgi:hypothetical protein